MSTSEIKKTVKANDEHGINYTKRSAASAARFEGRFFSRVSELSHSAKLVVTSYDCVRRTACHHYVRVINRLTACIRQKRIPESNFKKCAALKSVHLSRCYWPPNLGPRKGWVVLVVRRRLLYGATGTHPDNNDDDFGRAAFRTGVRVCFFGRWLSVGCIGAGLKHDKAPHRSQLPLGCDYSF